MLVRGISNVERQMSNTEQRKNLTDSAICWQRDNPEEERERWLFIHTILQALKT